MADPVKFKTTALDRALIAIAPKWALSRMQSRAAALTLARHYEAASVGRRTQNWQRRTSDANSAAGPALSNLRAHSRDLVRNNAWARNSVEVIARNVVGYGITPKVPKPLVEAWREWAGTTQCDAAGLLTFAGLQELVMRGVAESGEMLVRRRWRRLTDGLALPMQLHVLEPDFIDVSKNGIRGPAGGPIIYGIEFDKIGRRVAYWLFDEHPGSSWETNPASRRIPASEILHVYRVERAGQDRGIPWLAAAILTLKDFDEFEDAALMRQKIAACFAAFKTDLDGAGAAIGATSTDDPGVETLEPGMVVKLAPGQDVKFGNPPLTTDDGFSTRTLRRVAAAVGVPYEELVGDWSQVNFSSSRMSRIAHWGNVYRWQWNMLIPRFCVPAWGWAMEAADMAGLVSGAKPRAEWTPQPMPMTEPDREARANALMVRSGQKTLSQVIRENGGDPASQLEEYAADLKKLDALGIWLDVDVRRVSQAGLTQARPGGTGFNDDAKDAEEMAAQDESAPPPAGEDADTETEQDAGE